MFSFEHLIHNWYLANSVYWYGVVSFPFGDIKPHSPFSSFPEAKGFFLPLWHPFMRGQVPWSYPQLCLFCSILFTLQILTDISESQLGWELWDCLMLLGMWFNHWTYSPILASLYCLLLYSIPIIPCFGFFFKLESGIYLPAENFRFPLNPRSVSSTQFTGMLHWMLQRFPKTWLSSYLN